MEYDIQLVKGGDLKFMEWNQDVQDFYTGYLGPEDVILYLDARLCISNGVNLKDIFILISKNIDIFTTLTGCTFLEALVDEILSGDVENEDAKKILFLKLQKNMYVSEENFIFENRSLTGVGDDINYEIGFFN